MHRSRKRERVEEEIDKLFISHSLTLFFVTDMYILIGISCYNSGGQPRIPNWFYPQKDNLQTSFNQVRQSRQVFYYPDEEPQSDFSPFGQGLGQTGLENSNNIQQNTDNSGWNSKGTDRQFAGFHSTPNNFNQNNDDSIIFFDDKDDNDKSYEDTQRLGNQRYPTRSTTRSPSSIAVPGMGTTASPCEIACRTTSEYNPICADDGITYFSKARMECSQRCGKSK